MTEQTKKKMGAPKKVRTGKHIWIPAELIDTVNAIVQANKQAKRVKS